MKAECRRHGGWKQNEEQESCLRAWSPLHLLEATSVTAFVSAPSKDDFKFAPFAFSPPVLSVLAAVLQGIESGTECRNPVTSWSSVLQHGALWRCTKGLQGSRRSAAIQQGDPASLGECMSKTMIKFIYLARASKGLRSMTLLVLAPCQILVSLWFFSWKLLSLKGSEIQYLPVQV